MSARQHHLGLVDERVVLLLVSGQPVDREPTVAERKEIARRLHARGAAPAAIAERLGLPAPAVAAFLACEARR